MVHAYKYNGWLYRSWEYPLVLENNSEYIVLALIKSRVLSSEENSIRCFSSWVQKPTYWYLFKNNWFNLIITSEPEGIKSYINICSPFIYEEGAIKYYDFDLDFKINAHGQWREVDIKEFNENCEKYNYPPTLIQIIKDTEKDLVLKSKQKYFLQFYHPNRINKLTQQYLKLLKQQKEKD